MTLHLHAFLRIWCALFQSQMKECYCKYDLALQENLECLAWRFSSWCGISFYNNKFWSVFFCDYFLINRSFRIHLKLIVKFVVLLVLLIKLFLYSIHFLPTFTFSDVFPLQLNKELVLFNFVHFT